MQNTANRLKLVDSRPPKKTIRLLEWRSEMRCERCSRDEAPASFRVFSEIIDMKVCAACADEARKLRINVEPFDSGKKRAAAGILMNTKKEQFSTKLSLVPMLLTGESISPEARQALRESRLKDAAEILMKDYGLSCIEAGQLLDISACASE
jgi:ribosome-binding protein aMBF1 (putative translation factor)